MGNPRWGAAPKLNDSATAMRGFFTMSGKNFSDISDCSQTFADILGLSWGQVVNSNLLDLTPTIFEEDVQWAQSEINDLGKVTFFHTLEYITGQLLPVKITAVYISGMDVTVCGVDKIDRLPYPEISRQPYQKNLKDKLAILKRSQT